MKYLVSSGVKFWLVMFEGFEVSCYLTILLGRIILKVFQQGNDFNFCLMALDFIKTLKTSRIWKLKAAPHRNIVHHSWHEALFLKD